MVIQDNKESHYKTTYHGIKSTHITLFNVQIFLLKVITQGTSTSSILGQYNKNLLQQYYFRTT
jgi:hypothetical protein